MILKYQLGFKNKLRMVIILALVGFTVLSGISFNTLQVLSAASQRVDTINNNANLLQDLQLQVLHLNNKVDETALGQLLPKFDSQLQLLQSELTGSEAEVIAHIHHSLQGWVKYKQQWLQEREQLGIAADQGYRNSLAISMEAVKSSMFSTFAPFWQTFEHSVNALNEQRGQEQHQQALAALDAFEQHTIKLSFDDYYGEKVIEVKATLEMLATSIFALADQASNAELAYDSLATGIESSNAYLQQQLLQAQTKAMAANEQAKLLILGVCIGVALLVVGFLIRISHDVVSTLENMSQVLYKLADGDLTQRLAVNEVRNDELDKVGMAVNKMTASLSQVLTRVTDSSQTLDQGASDLSNNLTEMVNNNLETDKQAMSMAAATEQISCTIRDMSQAIDAAHQQAQQAHLSAEQGGEVINSAIGSLSELAQVFDKLNRQVGELEVSSKRVDGVIEMINSLAGQTNLLALNAAIEAARAGEAGRGFSVVADEVRNLAGKTVQATQDITDIIGEMQNGTQALMLAMDEGSAHVKQGSELGDKAATAVEQIKLLVHDVTERNKELSVNIEDVSESTAMIAKSMDSVASNVSDNKEQSQVIQSYVNDTSEKSTELLMMTKAFRCSPSELT